MDREQSPDKSYSASTTGANDASSNSSVSPKARQPLSIVGIGASAGGLQALKTLFSHVPKDSGLAYVVVVHLSPEHESHLAELLQPSIAMPVQQVNTSVVLEVNRVYIIPPNANLNSIDTHLRLSKLESNRSERAPIDHFFRTMANTHDGESIGVILTGTGSDGTLGIREIKGKGGLVIVQDPKESEFDGMPQSAIATGLPDFVLPLAEIANVLIRYSTARPNLSALSGEEFDRERSGPLQKIFNQLSAVTGRDFSNYKHQTILRRIQRRMQIHQIIDYYRYVELLQTNPDEVRALGEDFLITVTSFFRDSAIFDLLAKEVMSKLFNGKGPDDSIRLWVVGCSTGEEAYSLAMLLLDEAERRNSSSRLQIFASDLHDKSLAKAREGFYPGDIETDVPADKLNRYFIKDNGGYRIRKEVRELVTFAPQNLLFDPPFSRIDMISCRNLLIYIQRHTQRDVMRLFHYSLIPDGYLLLGSSETVEEEGLFNVVDKKSCVYRKRNVPSPELRLPIFPMSLRNPESPSRIRMNQDRNQQYGNLHLHALESYSPPSVLVGAQDQVLHFSKNVGKYLIQPGGEVTLNIFEITRDELRADLRAALNIAREQQRVFRSHPVLVTLQDRQLPLVLEVRPLAAPEYAGFALVLFDEGAERDFEIAIKSTTEMTQDSNRDPDRQARHEMELGLVKRQLQTAVHEFERSQEEMRAAYEEMQSTNEELRSTLEELETSKEELQSMNEELQTVNQENRHKVEEFAQLSSDLQNLLFATDIATLFLDRELRIMRFTPRTSDIFNLRLTDRGRPLTDITHRLLNVELKTDAELILKTLVPIEREVQDANGNWYLTRLLPYRSSEERIEGIVITFVDITRRKISEDALKMSDQKKNEFLAILAHELRNPLSPIYAGLEVLGLAGKNLDPYQGLIATMLRQVNQLVALVNDLLDISRISSGKFELKKRRIMLKEVIESAADAVRPALQQAGHQLSVSIEADGVELEADPKRLMQVLVNLLGNAAKFTPKGGKIQLHAWQEVRSVLISIKDNGRGIARSDLVRVFEMFAQVGDYKNSDVSGLGIGLTLAKTLIDMHGGEIDIRSEGLGTGCEARVRLPLIDHAAELIGLSQLQQVPQQGAAIRFKVLLIDDNVDVLEAVSMLLKLLGQEVRTASDGMKGLAIAAEYKPDLIFLDLGMPKMNGFETAKGIQALPGGSDITLVALSGWGTEEDRQATRDAGFDYHFVKPMSRDEISAFIGHLSLKSKAGG